MTDVRIITCTLDELRAVVREEVQRAVASHSAEPVEWIDATEAAKLLGVGTRTIQRLAKAGELPCTKLGTLLRFNRAAIDERLRRAG